MTSFGTYRVFATCLQMLFYLTTKQSIVWHPLLCGCRLMFPSEKICLSPAALFFYIDGACLYNNFVHYAVFGFVLLLQSVSAGCFASGNFSCFHLLSHRAELLIFSQKAVRKSLIPPNFMVSSFYSTAGR